MLISPSVISEYISVPLSILHIGAHLGEDKAIYDSYGYSKVFYVEPNPELFPTLKQVVGEQNCLNMAVADKAGSSPFHLVYSKDRTNKGCSSLLKPTEILDNPYLEFIKTINVETITLDFINEIYGPFNFLVMDIQGAELLALQGGVQCLKNNQFRGIILEFTLTSLYESDCKSHELNAFLKKYGYAPVRMEFANEANTWGDILYVLH